MKSCPAKVVCISLDEEEEFECKGTYFSDGTLECSVGKHTLSYDPGNINAKNPKRFILDGTKWSRFCVKSIILRIKR